MTFTCSICSKELKLKTATFIFSGYTMVAKEAICCKNYMDNKVENRGVPMVIRNERNGK